MTKKAYLHAEFRTHETASVAVTSLMAGGISKDSVELYSRRPVETDPPVLPRKSRMSLGAVLGAIAAGVTATALIFRIQLSYPLLTGGMPITSGWATAVVTFEATMAGAVLTTVLLMVWEAGLCRPRGRAPVPALLGEGVIVQVECTGGPAAASVHRCLTEAGAVRIDEAVPASALTS